MTTPPAKLRIQAGLVDVGVGLTKAIGMIAAWLWLVTIRDAVRVRMRWRGPLETLDRRRQEIQRRRRDAKKASFGLTPSSSYAMTLASWTLRLAGRNRPSAGYRRHGLSRVDAHSGGPVTMSSAVRGVLYDLVVSQIIDRLLSARTDPDTERVRAHEAQLAATRRRDWDAPSAQAEATRDYYRQHGLRPLVPVAWWATGLGGRGLAFLLLAVRGPTIRDRVTGTRVVARPRVRSTSASG